MTEKAPEWEREFEIEFFSKESSLTLALNAWVDDVKDPKARKIYVESVKSEIKDFIKAEKARSAGERDVQIASWMKYECSEFRGACGTCGGKFAEIRGRHPKGENRKVCPTCLMEKIEGCLSNLYPENQAGESLISGGVTE